MCVCVSEQVVGGRITESGRLGAFITKVKKGSLADVVGHLRAGRPALARGRGEVVSLYVLFCLPHTAPYRYFFLLLLLRWLCCSVGCADKTHKAGFVFVLGT